MFSSSHGNIFFFILYSNFKSTGFLFQEHAGIKKTKTKTKPPTILSTQTLSKYKHLAIGKKSLHFLVCNPINITPITRQRGIQVFSLKWAFKISQGSKTLIKCYNPLCTVLLDVEKIHIGFVMMILYIYNLFLVNLKQLWLLTSVLAEAFSSYNL